MIEYQLRITRWERFSAPQSSNILSGSDNMVFESRKRKPRHKAGNYTCENIFQCLCKAWELQSSNILSRLFHSCQSSDTQVSQWLSPSCFQFHLGKLKKEPTSTLEQHQIISCDVVIVYLPRHCRKNLPVESGTQLTKSGIREIFAYGFQNLGLLKYGIQLKESRVPLTIEIRNPVPVIRKPRQRIQTLLDSFTRADNILTIKIKH